MSVTVHARVGTSRIARGGNVPNATITAGPEGATFVSDDKRVAPVVTGPGELTAVVRTHVLVGGKYSAKAQMFHQLFGVDAAGRALWHSRLYVIEDDFEAVWPHNALAPLQGAGVAVRDERFGNKVELQAKYPGTSPHARWTQFRYAFPLTILVLAILVLIVGAFQGLL